MQIQLIDMLVRHLLFWFVLMFVAIGNGILREAIYGEWMKELTAHQVSTITGIVFTGIATYLFTRSRPLESQGQAWIVGVSWLVFTLLFEFIFGHYVADHSWHKLLHDYNIFAGRVWAIFLLWVVVMPTLFYRLNKRPGLAQVNK